MTNTAELDVKEKQVKRIFIAIMTVASLVLATAACSEEKAVVKKETLLHHNYELTSLNGKAVGWERIPEIAFNEGFRVSGRICNQFTGMGELKDGKLVVGQMASTKMLCVDAELNKLEHELSQMLMDGMDISLDGDTLTLKKGDQELVYTLRDKVN